jgi:hypothetical protein
MKVRWTEESVRLRISPEELERLQRGDSVEEELALHGDGWSAAIHPHPSETSLDFARGSLQMQLSRRQIQKLSEPETEGVYFQTPTEPPIRYLIEKDFPCVHPRASKAAEPVTPTFPPPEGFEERKR